MLKPIPLLTRYGSLTVMGVYRDRARRQTFVIALCDCGNLARVFAHNVKRGATTTCGNPRTHPRRRAEGTPITYGGMHVRLRTTHGPASRLDCADCDSPARDFSYMGNCPEELTGTVTDPRTGNTYQIAYCPHMFHYTPRCRVCHREYDRKKDV